MLEEVISSFSISSKILLLVSGARADIGYGTKSYFLFSDQLI
jgi:hypothetical protein